MDIVEIAGVVSAFTILLGTCWKLISVSHKTLKKMEDFDERVNRIEITQLKLALFSEDLSMDDRLEYGKMYLDLGGNGKGKLKYEELLDIAKEEMEEKHH